MAAGDTQITVASAFGIYEAMPYRRGLRGMPTARVTVRIMKHAVNPGEKYGNLTIIREVRKVAPSGKSYRAVRCRCDCGNELTSRSPLPYVRRREVVRMLARAPEI